MIPFLCKNLTKLMISNPNSSNIRKSPLSFKNLSTFSPNPSNLLLQNHNFDPKFLSRIATELTHAKSPENAASILSFLRESGFPDSRLAKVVKTAPRLLSVSLEHSIKPKIRFFQGIGLSSADISKMISGHPGILELSLIDNIIPSVALLNQLLGSEEKAARVIRIAPRVLPTNLGKTMLLNVEFLKSCGVPIERIRIVLASFPSPFLLKPEVMRKSAEKAIEIGVNAASKSFIYAVPTIASMGNEAWLLKWGAFRDLGFSDSEIVAMFRKAPLVFAVSMEKIRRIKELLLGTGRYTLSSIVEFPASLQFSVEKRYLPRLRILGILESKNVIEDWPPLRRVCLLSDDKFFEKFVSPFSDIDGDVCFVANPARDGRR